MKTTGIEKLDNIITLDTGKVMFFGVGQGKAGRQVLPMQILYNNIDTKTLLMSKRVSVVDSMLAYESKLSFEKKVHNLKYDFTEEERVVYGQAMDRLTREGQFEQVIRYNASILGLVDFITMYAKAGVKNIIIDNYRYLDNFADSKEVFDAWDDIVKVVKEHGINLYMFYNLYNECRENNINKKSMYKFTKKFVDSSDYVFMIPAYDDSATSIKVLCYGKENIEGIVELDFDKEARLLS